MGDNHSKSFFGQNTGILINSPSKSEPYFFIRCIKRKPDGVWEKPSNREGKVIKCTLEEIIMILQVLNRETLNWTSYHSYKDNKTPISFSWEDDKAKTLWINIADYSKMLNFAQAEILRLLLTHLLSEKIEFATISNMKNNSQKVTTNIVSSQIEDNLMDDNSIISFKEDYEETQFEKISNNKFNQNTNNSYNTQQKKDDSKEISDIDGSIVGETAKALLINFNSGQELWIPKSTIHCQYNPARNLNQKFAIDDWILKRNKVLS